MPPLRARDRFCLSDAISLFSGTQGRGDVHSATAALQTLPTREALSQPTPGGAELPDARSTGRSWKDNADPSQCSASCRVTIISWGCKTTCEGFRSHEATNSQACPRCSTMPRCSPRCPSTMMPTMPSLWMSPVSPRIGHDYLPCWTWKRARFVWSCSANPESSIALDRTCLLPSAICLAAWSTPAISLAIS